MQVAMKALNYAEITSSGGLEKSSRSARSISIKASETSFRGIFSNDKCLVPTANKGSPEV
jgi:hypothetical protein